jgi:hypothetical protein
MFRRVLGHLGKLAGTPLRLRREVLSIQRNLHALAAIERERYLKEIKRIAMYDHGRRLPRFGSKVYGYITPHQRVAFAIGSLGQRPQ